MKNNQNKFNYEDYTKRFNDGYKKAREAEKKYIENNNLGEEEEITSQTHTEYFQIDKEWKELRAKLDKPLIEAAYFKIGDELLFVKRNTYHGEEKERLLPAGVLMDKRLNWFSSVHKIFYANVISRGIITDIGTSSDGSGEIIYYFNKLTPPCPERNPYCKETDILYLDSITQDAAKRIKAWDDGGCSTGLGGDQYDETL